MGSTLTWNDFVIAIPTMPQRQWMLSQLLAYVRPECVGAEIVVREHEEGVPAKEDFPRLIDLAMATGRKWILQIEDDVWPAANFGGLSLTAIAEAAGAGADAVTLFSRSKKDVEMMAKKQHLRAQSPSSFCMMQAVAVRREMLDGFALWAPTWYSENPRHYHAADLLLGTWLSRKKCKMLAYVPSLVQHRKVLSTLPGARPICRQSQTYTMAFGGAP